MSEGHSYSLERYGGTKTRHTCPACGEKRCFSLYVNEAGEPLSEDVGRCDHESACGYHKTPKQYFAEHPELTGNDWRELPKGWKPPKAANKVKQQIEKKICTIPEDFMQKSVRPDIHSDFTTFLGTLFPTKVIKTLTERYNLGVTKARDVIYFQVDMRGGVRTGKIMKYNPKTGKRVKNPETPFKINWVHSVMKHAGLLPNDWELTQCLFGEHLLSDDNFSGASVALVESEKTAVIASALMPKYIWLATGGKSQLKEEKLAALSGRKVIAFPDVDGYQEWKEKLSKVSGIDITVSNVLEKNATEEDRQNHIDIADWLIRWRSESVQMLGLEAGLPATKEQNNEPKFKNPHMKLVAKFFEPSSLEAVEELMNELDLIPVSVSRMEPI